VSEAESRQVNLVQTIVDCPPAAPHFRAAGESEEVMFVLEGAGEIEVNEKTYPLEPESGVYLAPGEECWIRPRTPLKLISVEIPDPTDGPAAARKVVRRVADQRSQSATTDREFRIVADPSTGLHSATQFVGYIPTARSPDHFHTYDEVIYVLDGEGVLHTESGDQPVSPGSQIELPARTIHCLENTGDDVMRIVAVFRPAGSPAAAYYPDGTPAHEAAPVLQ
jgi:mannose-6-phosphate isomerase-like protein (cupin superfamily)